MSMFTLVLSLIKPFKKDAVLLFLVLLCSAFVETLSLGMVLPFLESVLDTSSSFGISFKWIDHALNQIPKEYHVPVLAVSILILMIFREGLILFRAYMEARFSAVLRVHWSSSIMKNYLNAPYAYVRKSKQGVLLNNIMRETLESSRGLKDLIDLLAKAILVGSLIVLLFIVSPWVTLVSLVFGFFFMALQWRLTTRLSLDIGKKRMKLNQKLSSAVTECLSGLRQVKTFSLEDIMHRMFYEQMQNLEDVKVNLHVLKTLPRTFGNGLVLLLLIIGMVLSMKVFKISIKELIPLAGVFFATSQRLFINLSGILSQRMIFLSTLPSIQLVHRLQNEKVYENESFGSRVFETFSHHIQFKDVAFEYVADKPIFSNLNIVIPKNHFVGIAGPSGSGKSTLCDLLAGFYNPSKGQIMIDETPMQEFNLTRLREKIGYISQDPFLFNNSIYENIRCGRNDASREEVLAVALLAGVDEFVKSMPNGYDTHLNQNADSLSGGQKQKIAIARALIRNPEILIFDEATSALDAQSEKMILDVARNLRGKTTILWISHRLNTMKSSDCIYVFDEGRIAEQGSYDVLLKNEGLFKKLSNINHSNHDAALSWDV